MPRVAAFPRRKAGFDLSRERYPSKDSRRPKPWYLRVLAGIRLLAGTLFYFFV
jgi:hypothetical protein